MAQSSPNDSDCIIEDPNITCITLDDSQDGENFVLEEQITTTVELELEEGEVNDVEEKYNEEGNICEIKFNNQKKFQKFGNIIIDALKVKLNQSEEGSNIEIITNEDKESITLTVQYVQDDIKDIPIPPSLMSASILHTDEKTECFKKEQSPDLSGLSALFMIDTEPAAKIDSVKVPSYKRAIKDALLDEEAAAHKKQKQEEDVFKKAKTYSCFNCGDSAHSIKDCTKPHNPKRIKNARRQIFKAERYHVDVEQRFAHLKPGLVSDKLRDAMGLRKGELPFFYYRMRVLGYPPGWLENAKVEHSGITLFNSDGSKILHSDEDEGEVDTTNHKYNISKIVEFPGFNQDPGKNFYDDYKYHNVPPFAEHQMKKEFVKTLGDTVLKAYKRKKLKDFPNATNDDSSINDTSIHEAADMDIEDSETTTLGNVEFTRPPPPTEPPPETEDEAKPPPPPSTPSPSCETPTNINENAQYNFSPTPSLNDLEKQKQQLLQELEANTSVIEIEDSLIDEIIALDDDDENNTSNIDQDLDKEPNPIENTNKHSDNSSDLTSVTKKMTDLIKESFMGTPIIKFSPYDNLPNGDNFKVGVSDVINFENLPDSTGKYEQMKMVIKKVRNVIHKLHSEE